VQSRSVPTAGKVNGAQLAVNMWHLLIRSSEIESNIIKHNKWCHSRRQTSVHCFRCHLNSCSSNYHILRGKISCPAALISNHLLNTDMDLKINLKWSRTYPIVLNLRANKSMDKRDIRLHRLRILSNVNMKRFLHQLFNMQVMAKTKMANRS
jgi:hypothetical protein